ncbi:MAG: ORF6N domain-containing protein [Candidatus Margulisiibacteriota bacterium]
MNKLVPAEIIEQRIFHLRGQKVMLDRDLAELYQVKTMALNQAVKRNPDRFPAGFMFQLSKKEKNELITNCDRLQPLKHSPVFPNAFTEQGVAMLSSVLKSKRAIRVNIIIMLTFVKLRQIASRHRTLLRKIDEMEKKYDRQFKIVFDALRELITPPEKPKRSIGFMRD